MKALRLTPSPRFSDYSGCHQTPNHWHCLRLYSSLTRNRRHGSDGGQACQSQLRTRLGGLRLVPPLGILESDASDCRQHKHCHYDVVTVLSGSADSLRLVALLVKVKFGRASRVCTTCESLRLALKIRSVPEILQTRPVEGLSTPRMAQKPRDSRIDVVARMRGWRAARDQSLQPSSAAEVRTSVPRTGVIRVCDGECCRTNHSSHCIISMRISFSRSRGSKERAK